MNTVVQQLAGSVEARDGAFDPGAEFRLQARTGGIERAKQLGHGLLQVGARQVVRLFAGQQLVQRGIEFVAVAPVRFTRGLEAWQQAGQQVLVAQ
ncbi:hypothetical protein D9M71_516410 [compost metagenome]